MSANYLHSKYIYLRLDVGYFYNFNLFATNFKFNVSNKSKTIAQKGDLLQRPFHTMPSADVSFTTYVKSKEDLNLLMQLGYEQMTGTLLALDSVDHSMILRGDGIIKNVTVNGRAGAFVTVQVSMSLEKYSHSETPIFAQFIQ